MIQGIEALYGEYKTQDVFHAITCLKETSWDTHEFDFYDPNMNEVMFCVGV